MMNVSRFPLSGIIFLVPLNHLGKRYPTNLDDVCESFYNYEKHHEFSYSVMTEMRYFYNFASSFTRDALIGLLAMF